MTVVEIVGAWARDVELDVCRSCQFVWFDPGELEELGEPDRPAEPSDDKVPLPPEVRQAFARFEVEAIAERARSQEQGEEAHPALWGLAVLGLPVKIGTHALQRVPFWTWSLLGVTFLASVAAFGDIEAIAASWGFVSAEPLRHFGLTLVVPFFLHGGWVHLLSNLYFLWIFGDSVEDVLGGRRFLFLLLLATVGGNLVQLIAAPGQAIPCIGASGGISGVMIAYAVLFPRSRLGLLLFLVPVRIPIILFFCVWLVLQIAGALALSEFSNVAFGAHIGGALVGLALGLRWRRRG
jgi:membrane associated rhomboid family serine protease